LKGANFDESIIKLKLKEKKFPEEIISEYSNDFLIITNGIPLFVDKIPLWDFSVIGPDSQMLNDLRNYTEDIKKDLSQEIKNISLKKFKSSRQNITINLTK